MLFLSAINIISLYLLIVGCIGLGRMVLGKPTKNGHRNAVRLLVLLLAVMLCGAPLWFSVYSRLGPIPFSHWSNNTTISSVLSLLGSVIMLSDLAPHSLTFLFNRPNNRTIRGSLIAGILSGCMVVVFINALIIGISSGSQLLWISKGHNGFVGFTESKEQKELILGSKCDSVVVAIHQQFDPSKPTEFRCPTGIMLQQASNAPYIPWPDYDDGESIGLTKYINKMEAEAKANTSAVHNDEAQGDIETVIDDFSIKMYQKQPIEHSKAQVNGNHADIKVQFKDHKECEFQVTKATLGYKPYKWLVSSTNCHPK